MQRNWKDLPQRKASSPQLIAVEVTSFSVFYRSALALSKDLYLEIEQQLEQGCVGTPAEMNSNSSRLDYIGVEILFGISGSVTNLKISTPRNHWNQWNRQNLRNLQNYWFSSKKL